MPNIHPPAQTQINFLDLHVTGPGNLLGMQSQPVPLCLMVPQLPTSPWYVWFWNYSRCGFSRNGQPRISKGSDSDFPQLKSNLTKTQRLCSIQVLAMWPWADLILDVEPPLCCKVDVHVTALPWSAEPKVGPKWQVSGWLEENLGFNQPKWGWIIHVCYVSCFFSLGQIYKRGFVWIYPHLGRTGMHQPIFSSMRVQFAIDFCQFIIRILFSPCFFLLYWLVVWNIFYFPIYWE